MRTLTVRILKKSFYEAGLITIFTLFVFYLWSRRPINIVIAFAAIGIFFLIETLDAVALVPLTKYFSHLITRRLAQRPSQWSVAKGFVMPHVTIPPEDEVIRLLEKVEATRLLEKALRRKERALVIRAVAAALQEAADIEKSIAIFEETLKSKRADDLIVTVAKALKEMDAVSRELFLKLYGDKLTVEETAKQTGLSPLTVRLKQARARKKIRKSLRQVLATIGSPPKQEELP